MNNDNFAVSHRKKLQTRRGKCEPDKLFSEHHTCLQRFGSFLYFPWRPRMKQPTPLLNTLFTKKGEQLCLGPGWSSHRKWLVGLKLLDFCGSSKKGRRRFQTTDRMWDWRWLMCSKPECVSDPWLEAHCSDYWLWSIYPFVATGTQQMRCESVFSDVFRSELLNSARSFQRSHLANICMCHTLSSEQLSFRYSRFNHLMMESRRANLRPVPKVPTVM